MTARKVCPSDCGRIRLLDFVGNISVPSGPSRGADKTVSPAAYTVAAEFFGAGLQYKSEQVFVINDFSHLALADGC
jgi:hypothetical protein